MLWWNNKTEETDTTQHTEDTVVDKWDKSYCVDLIQHQYEMMLSMCPLDASYNLKEKLTSGTIVTHKRGCDCEELKSYVRSVFSKKRPQHFILTFAYQPTL